MDETATEAAVWAADSGRSLAGGEDGLHHCHSQTHQVCCPGVWGEQEEIEGDRERVSE